MVFESLSGFQSNLHVFPLFIDSFHPYCPEDWQVSDVDHFPSWDWGVSGFCKLQSFFNFSNRSTIGIRNNHSCLIFCSLSSMSMGEMVQ